jgi:hypothetical protein
MKLENCVKENKIVIFVVSNKKYVNQLNEITSAVTKTNKNILYVTLNKSYKVLAESFEKKGIDTKKITFIDSVSGGVQKPKDYKVYFVSSPKALTELSITINETMKQNIDIMVLDSLSTLLVYEDPLTVVKFVHSIVSKIRDVNKKCVMTSLSEDAGKSILKDLSMFVDKVIVLK